MIFWVDYYFKVRRFESRGVRKLGESWMDEPITLQLDHMNGDKKDKRLENLCLLCPNCHSQKKTFAGRKY